jgi:hypothetical protein
MALVLLINHLRPHTHELKVDIARVTLLRSREAWEKSVSRIGEAPLLRTSISQEQN